MKIITRARCPGLHQQTCKIPRQRSASLGHLGGCGNSGRPFARLCTGRATRALHSNRRGLIPKICKDRQVIGKIRNGPSVLGGCIKYEGPLQCIVSLNTCYLTGAKRSRAVTYMRLLSLSHCQLTFFFLLSQSRWPRPTHCRWPPALLQAPSTRPQRVLQQQWPARSLSSQFPQMYPVAPRG